MLRCPGLAWSYGFGVGLRRVAVASLGGPLVIWFGAGGGSERPGRSYGLWTTIQAALLLKLPDMP